MNNINPLLNLSVALITQVTNVILGATIRSLPSATLRKGFPSRTISNQKKGENSMIKTRQIVKATITIQLLLGVIALGAAENRSASWQRQAKTDSVRLIALKLTFPGGNWAVVTEIEGGTARIEENGNVLTITPYIRDKNSGTVELKVFRVIRREGNEEMEAAGSLLVGKSPTKLNSASSQFSVEVKGVEKTMPADLISTTANQCCVRTCSGILICGVCVCTDCHFCTTNHACDCNPPA
jgi:hypothetical protein